MRLTQALWLTLLCGASFVGCSEDRSDLATTVAAHDAVLHEMPRDFYEPGLGDLMHALQLRHAKLWFAGRAGNWELAAFELHEIHENLDRVARWHGDNREIPMAPSIKAYMQPGRQAIERSIAERKVAAFEAGFDRLTQGCNDCHRTAKHEFIVIQRPRTPPLDNQAWTIPH